MSYVLLHVHLIVVLIFYDVILLCFLKLSAALKMFCLGIKIQNTYKLCKNMCNPYSETCVK